MNLTHITNLFSSLISIHRGFPIEYKYPQKILKSIYQPYAKPRYLENYTDYYWKITSFIAGITVGKIFVITYYISLKV